MLPLAHPYLILFAPIFFQMEHLIPHHKKDILLNPIDTDQIRFNNHIKNDAYLRQNLSPPYVRSFTLLTKGFCYLLAMRGNFWRVM